MKPTSLNVCRAGVVLMVAAIGLRVLTTYDPMPGWSGDPFESEYPIVGLTPALALLVDAILVLASGLLLGGMAARGVSPRWWEVALAAAGAVAAAVHAQSGLADYIPGSCWTAAIFAGLAASVAAREPALRGLLAAGLLGLLAPLVLKGAVQLAIDHPQTYQSFLRDRTTILNAQGWSEGSPMALAYERRLLQAEASGWFGMANVYAGVMAAMFVIAAGLLRALCASTGPAALPRARSPIVILALAALGAAAGVCLAGAKGGYVVAVAGLGFLAVPGIIAYFIRTPSGAGWALRRRWVRDGVGVAVALACIALPLLAVTARGLIGERLGELSLLFRWFYISTAAHIFADHPLLGVGPGGFKDAYMLAKPAISPEDVSSPHSVFFDYAATLGVGGLAWSALWVVWACRAGRTLLSDAPAQREGVDPGPPLSFRTEVLLIGVALVIPTFAANNLERVLASPESALLRMGGVILGVATAAAALAAFRSPAATKWASAAVAAGALVAVAHAQIELTAVTPGSAALLAVLLGVAGVSRATAPAVRPTVWIVFTVVALGLITHGIAGVWRWESALRSSYARAAPVARIAGDMNALATGRADPREVGDVLRALDQALAPLPRAATPAESLDRLRAERRRELMPTLLAAHEAQLADVPTFQAYSRLAFAVALGRTSPDHAAAAGVADRTILFAEQNPSASSWAWASLACKLAAQARPDAAPDPRALVAIEAAANLAPHSTIYTSLAAVAAAESGDAATARGWALKALQNDANARLDPLTGLSATTRREMERLARDGN